MSENSMDDAKTIEIAAFLRRNPGFLASFPDLALSLALPRMDGRATSLASYQLDVLRDKNRELNRRLHELYAVANENERLTMRMHQLTLALMRANNAANTLRALAASLIEDFQSDLLRIVLLHPVADAPETEWLRTVAAGDPALTPFAEFRAGGEPLCGRLQPDKLEFLFGERAAEVQSTALVTAGERALLAIGSRDPGRFFPGMGTLFLRLLGESVAAALARFEHQTRND